MRKTKALLGIFLLVMPLALTGCGKKTTRHNLAIFTAQADAALIAFTDSTARLVQAGRVSGDAAKQIYTINLRLASSIDILRERARKGFDKKDTLTVIDTVIEDIRAAEALGVVNLSGEVKTRFLQVTFFAQFTARSIKAIIEASKSPAPPENVAREVMAAQNRAQQADQTVWTDLVLILQTAVLRGYSQSRMTEDEAFADGVLLSNELKASLSAKLGAI